MPRLLHSRSLALPPPRLALRTAHPASQPPHPSLPLLSHRCSRVHHAGAARGGGGGDQPQLGARLGARQHHLSTGGRTGAVGGEAGCWRRLQLLPLRTRASPRRLAATAPCPSVCPAPPASPAISPASQPTTNRRSPLRPSPPSPSGLPHLCARRGARVARAPRPHVCPVRRAAG